MSSTLQAALDDGELRDLVERIFRPRVDDGGIALLVDLPPDRMADHETWAWRRGLAVDWLRRLAEPASVGLPVGLYWYPRVGANNAELPATVFRHRIAEDRSVAVPGAAEELDAEAGVALAEVLDGHRIVLAPTEYSATAPLKLLARRHRLRAATLPGFSAEMVPALRLDFEDVDRRVRRLAHRLDEANGAVVHFRVEDGRADGDREATLELDLRHRRAHASGGLLREPGSAGNLPSGEAYIVPYEGERAGDPSRSRGLLPVELDGEVVIYEVAANRAVAVRGGGPVARREADLLEREPAYGNLAELGLGVLAELGIEAIGRTLLDEKLGLHIAFGRSDHFGGQVGPTAFSRADAVVHLDRVYLPASQPRVSVPAVDLVDAAGQHQPLMRDGRYLWPSDVEA